MPNTRAKVGVLDILAHVDAENPAESTLISQISQPPNRFHLTTLLVIVWSVLLLGVSAMLVVQLPEPMALIHKQTIPMYYGLQIPTAILVSAFLGKRFGTFAMVLFLIGGLAGLPLFAGGGGLHYYESLSAGYLAGFLFLPWAIHPALTRAYKDKGWFRGRSIWMLISAIAGVAMVHAFGLVGLGVHALAGDLTWAEALNWLIRLTWPTLIYDIAFGLVAIATVRLCRMLFWFCLY